MGGSDENSNLVALTPEEHFVAHVLLVKLYPEHRGLIQAVQQMCSSNEMTLRRPKRKLYGWLKRRHAEYMRESQSGSGNSQFGTKWIHQGLVNRKIQKDELIPEGWEQGRQIKNQRQKLCGCGMPLSGKFARLCRECLSRSRKSPKKKIKLPYPRVYGPYQHKYDREPRFIIVHKNGSRENVYQIDIDARVAELADAAGSSPATF